MSDQPFWGLAGMGWPNWGACGQNGEIWATLPWVETKGAIKSATPLEFLRKVVLRKIGSWVEFRQLVDRVFLQTKV